MEGLFRQFGIFSQEGQLYVPQDADQVMYYKEDKNGQILQEGINEAGAMCLLDRRRDLVLDHRTVSMIPFYIYYSMFGFQRIGDLAWAAGDMRARGFLLGGTSGRTTLNGEGLQHEDGHSHILPSTIPNCVSYDPTFAYELAVIIQDGLSRMVDEQEDVFYYITLLNENYPHPAHASRGRGRHPQGHVPAAGRRRKAKGQRGPAAGLRHHPARGRWPARSCWRRTAASRADVWSVTSFTELAPRGAGRRALEPAASARATARAVYHAAARGHAARPRSSPPPTT